MSKEQENWKTWSTKLLEFWEYSEANKTFQGTNYKKHYYKATINN